MQPRLADGMARGQILQHAIPGSRPVFRAGGKQMASHGLKQGESRREIAVRYRPEQIGQTVGQPSGESVPGSQGFRIRANPL